jgi:ATP-dependent Clp protease ATP-binding subunit ClpA
VKVDEPTISETREILFGLRPRLEKNYSVTISDDAINTALEMAPKYIRNLHLPDKAIGWLDTAAVKVEINLPQAPVVLPEHIIDVISQESRIPARHDLSRHGRPFRCDGRRSCEARDRAERKRSKQSRNACG